MEEDHIENASRQAEDEEMTSIQPTTEVGRAPEVGRGALSSDLNDAQEPLNGPARAKVALEHKRNMAAMKIQGCFRQSTGNYELHMRAQVS